MHLFDLITELEVDAPAANAVSPLRILAIGKFLGLAPGQRVVDFGCGRGELLCLWARSFGVRGVGVDLSAPMLAEAQARAKRWGIAEQLEFHCKPAMEYDYGAGDFDVAVCMGATMAFEGFTPTIRYLKNVIRAGGSLVIGEPFYNAIEVPKELVEYEGPFHTQEGLFEIARREGFEIGYHSRATRDEWDQYIFNSRGAELKEFLNLPAGKAREDRRVSWHHWQDMYLRYRQKWQEIGFFTLHPG
jgi:cyclopropane fatty-acyl-phospholipid synthase-like methyltransferase